MIVYVRAIVTTVWLSLVLAALWVFFVASWAMNRSQAAMPPSKEIVQPHLHEEFVASVDGLVYHLPGCPHVRRIAKGNRVGFLNLREAQLSGRKPCSRCLERIASLSGQ